jgi:hypothetical protein
MHLSPYVHCHELAVAIVSRQTMVETRFQDAVDQIYNELVLMTGDDECYETAMAIVIGADMLINPLNWFEYSQSTQLTKAEQDFIKRLG